MEVMEECIGGKHKGLAYNKPEYQKWCEDYDKETEEELAKVEASMSVRIWGQGFRVVRAMGCSLCPNCMAGRADRAPCMLPACQQQALQKKVADVTQDAAALSVEAHAQTVKA